MHRVHVYPVALYGQADFDSTVMVFDFPVSEHNLRDAIENGQGKAIACLRDCTPEEEGSIVAALREVF